MKILLIAPVFILSALIASGQPVINSFSPSSGPVGSAVTILGSNFNATASNNAVFFGAVKANVITATASSLTATVPTGATYDLITVTNLVTNLTAYSLKPFHITFPGAGPVFTATSFNTHVDFASGDFPYSHVHQDFDHDNKPDFISANGNGSIIAKTLSVLKNNSTGGSLSFPGPSAITTGDAAGFVAPGDIDGDGQKDLLMLNGNFNSVSVYRNISTAGTIILAGNIDFPLGLNPGGIAVGDIDLDGKPDIAALNGNDFNLSVLRNTSTGSNISFAPRINLPTGSSYIPVIIRDIDGDAKPDIIVASFSENKLTIYRNTSTPGNLSFAPRFDLITGNRPYGIAVGDLDNDGRPDIVTSNNLPGNISVFRNNGSPSNLAFDPVITLPNGGFTQKIAIGDLDGDGKLDVAVTRSEGLNQLVSVHKSNSSPGAILFAAKVDYEVADGPISVSIGDVDGDGLPDIAATASYANQLTILRNTTVCPTAAVSIQPADSVICAGSNATFSVTASNVNSYQWQVDDGSGWSAVVNSGVYTGSTTATLNITGAALSMNSFYYRCMLSNACGPVYTSAAKLTVNTPVAPSVVITATTVTACQGAAVTFTAAGTNGGSTPSYQWKKNNINTGANAATYTDNSLSNGDVITCVFTSSAACISAPDAVSNQIIMTITAPVVPIITISASANGICYGTAVSFTAVTSNAGTTPLFQWKKNNIATGTNNAVYTDNTINNGDIISCTLTSSQNCITVASVTSNPVVMNILPSVTPSITITASSSGTCPGVPVTFTAAVTNGGTAPVYSWKKNGNIVGANLSAYTDNGLSNGDVINCVLVSNAAASCLTATTVTSNSISASVLNMPGNVNLGADKAICSGTAVLLSPQPGYVSYTWQDGSLNAVYSATTQGRYFVTVKDACGNLSSDTVDIVLLPAPAKFLAKDTSICSYASILLKTQVAYTKYLWSTNETNGSITVNRPGLYWLQVTDNNNCSGKDTIMVSSHDCITGVYFPNAFTPNSDLKNDVFRPVFYANVLQYELIIYNTYGEKVFYSTDKLKGWDGKYKDKAQNSNAFVWVCTYRLEGKPLTAEKGTVILVR